VIHPIGHKRRAGVSPDMEAAIAIAVQVMRRAQKLLGSNARRDAKRGRKGPSTSMAEELERAAAAMYEQMDREAGRPPWAACEGCGERVRSMEAHKKGLCRGAAK